MQEFKNKSILISGGTGSFGKECVKNILKQDKAKKVVVFSRDEQKQYEMAKQFPENKYPKIRYFLGDIRDYKRLELACSGIDIIIHAAAIKIVSSAEYNPTECIVTNIIGAQNIIQASIKNNVKKVIALSTDKAANPINLYGATKLCSDKLFVAANNLSGEVKTKFSVVRYGNVVASRGSVIPYFKQLLLDGKKKLPLTNIEMTRFLITLEQGVKFVINCVNNMSGGEIFVPKLFSIKILDLIEAMAGKGNYNIIGLRPGEKIHEVMIPKEESLNCIDMKDYYIIQPMFSWWNTKQLKKNLKSKGKLINKSFEYASNTNKDWFTKKEIMKLLKSI